MYGLDRHITGNYGEDQFGPADGERDPDELDDSVESQSGLSLSYISGYMSEALSSYSQNMASALSGSAGHVLAEVMRGLLLDIDAEIARTRPALAQEIAAKTERQNALGAPTWRPRPTSPLNSYTS